MISGKRVLAVVPARGGSRGVPLKNLRLVAGVPLVGLVGDVLKQCASIDRAVVSTDHDGIAEAAAAHDIEAFFRRPEDLSGDRVSDIPVLRHALQTTERDDGERYDIVVMLQPTSPMRRPEHVERTLRDLVDRKLDAAWTVSETDSKGHPLKQLVVEDGLLDHYDQRGEQIIARQQLSTVYHRNGVAYALTRECLLAPEDSLKGKRTGAVIIDEPMVNIDAELDFKLAEILMDVRESEAQ